MNFKLMFLLFAFLAFTGCSNLSKNFIKSGDLTMKGGHFQNQSWRDEISFKRYSWFHEMTMVFDVLLARVPTSSPFYQWFSNPEKSTLNDCRDSYVVMTYHWDSKKVSKSDFLAEAEKAGYEKVDLKNFAAEMRLHPDFESLSLQLYSVFGLCRENNLVNNSTFFVNFPGFREVNIR